MKLMVFPSYYSTPLGNNHLLGKNYPFHMSLPEVVNLFQSDLAVKSGVTL